MGRLAQLVRAPALQAGGRQFEPVIAHHFPPRTPWIERWKAAEIRAFSSRTEKPEDYFEMEGGCRLTDPVNWPKHHPRNPEGGVAQSVRALACHARGRGFESRHSRHFFLDLQGVAPIQGRSPQLPRKSGSLLPRTWRPPSCCGSRAATGPHGERRSIARIFHRPISDLPWGGPSPGMKGRGRPPLDRAGPCGVKIFAPRRFLFTGICSTQGATFGRGRVPDNATRGRVLRSSQWKIF